MATTSLGSSTTQIEVWSRRGSAQMRQRSACATLPHTSQKRTLARTSVRAVTRRVTSSDSVWSRWKAMRCALLGPTPGSRPSSSMRSWTMPSYICGLVLEPQAGEPAGAAGAPARERAERLGGQRVGLGLGVAVGGHDHVAEVGEVVGVGAVEPAGPDVDADQL